jgi:hypothetical protein
MVERAMRGAMVAMGPQGLRLAMLVQCLAVACRRDAAARNGMSSARSARSCWFANPELLVGRAAFEADVADWSAPIAARRRYPGQRQAESETQRLREAMPVTGRYSTNCASWRAVPTAVPGRP